MIVNNLRLLAFASASTAHINYINDDQSTDTESFENEDKISQSLNNNELRLLKKIIYSIIDVKSDDKPVHRQTDVRNEEEYDYNTYYVNDKEEKLCIGNTCLVMIPGKPPLITREEEKEDTSEEKICKGNKCLMMIPGKTPLVIKEDRDSSSSSDEVREIPCKDNKCLVMIPGKPPFIMRKEEETKDSSGDYRSDSQNDSGYERDDEDEVKDIGRVRCNRGYNYKTLKCKVQLTTPSSVLNNNTILTTTPKPFKKFEDKTTDEITSADLDMYIPDSFEKRSDKDDEVEAKRKFSTDYLDIEDLFTIATMQLRAKEQENAGKDNNNNYVAKFSLKKEKGNPIENVIKAKKDGSDAQVELTLKDSTGDSIPTLSSKDLIKMLRMGAEDDENEGSRKWSRIKKAWVRKGYSTTPRSVDSDSDDDSADEVPAEDSDTEPDSPEEKPKKRPKKLNRFEVVAKKSKKHKAAESSESDEIKPKDTSETIEPISDEIKPKPKKKSKLRIPGKPEHYTQSFGRLYQEGKDFRKGRGLDILDWRKRMPHFMPKRYHWDPEDFQKLGYFWFNGPQGKVPGPWRIAY